MTLEDQRRTYDGPVSWLDRLKRARYVLAAAALVFLALDVMGILSAVQASIGFVIVAAASLIDFTTAEDHVAAAPSHEGKPLAADWLVEAVVSGLPDAVIALDRRGIVVASNAAARVIAPALTRGAPLSLRAAHSRHHRSGAPRGRDRRDPARRVLREGAGRPLVGGLHRAGRARGGDRGPARAGAGDAARSHPAQAGRGDARRLRRQCEPRAAHAARVALRLHRDAAGLGAQRRRRRASASSTS